MADSKRDIELVIRARDLGSKTLSAVTGAVAGLTSALDDQVAAAKRGEVSNSELRDTMRQLEQAGAALIKQQGIVDLYSRIATELGVAETKAEAAKAAQEAMTAAQANSASVTKKQQAELVGLGRASDQAQRRVEALQASLAVQHQRLAAAGIDTSNLAAAQQQIATTAERVGGALQTVGGALDGYHASVRAVRTEQKALDDEAQKAAQTAAFRKVGDDALSSADSLHALSTAQVAAGGTSSELARSLHSILDPSAAAVTTLSGLEERVTAVSAQVGAADKPIYQYTDAINELSRIQAAILSQAKDVDAFRNQQTAVERATRAYNAAQTEVRKYAEAVRTAGAPSDELAAHLKQAQATLVASARDLDNEKTKLDRLRISLDRAGIGSSDLAAVQKRLQATSETAAASLQKLDKAASGQNTRAGRFLGLRPYELQNLGFQINDIFTQLASGTSITQTLAQQGGQLVQIFPQMFKTVLRFFPEIALAVGVLSTVVLTVKRLVDQANLVRAFGAQLAASAESAHYQADALAESTRRLSDYGTSLKDATSAVKEFLKAGVDPSRLDDFGRAAKDLADITGVKVTDAAKQMAQGFSGGYAQIKKLDDEFDFLTLAERVQIKAMFDSGNAAEARTRAFDIFAKKMGDAATQARGPWSDAFRSLGRAWNNFLDFLGQTPDIQKLTNDFWGLAKAAEYLASKLPGAKGGADPLANLTAEQRRLVDMDQAVRTVIGEAGPGASPISRQAVAQVLRNRSDISGQSITDVVHAKGQFEPWGDPKTAQHLASIDQTSKEYLDTLKDILPILDRQQVSVVGKNATNFFAPAAQAALGRKTPGFAQPQRLIDTIGGHQFFSGDFPGSNGVIQQTEAAAKAGRDYLDELNEQYALERKVSDAERIRTAGLKALREAEQRGADPVSQKQAQQLAENNERWKVNQERMQQAQQLASDLASSLQSAAAGQDADLQTRLSAISQHFQVIYDKIKRAKDLGLEQVDGKTLDALVKQQQEQEKILKQQETMKFYEEQISDIQKQRADQISAIQARLAAGQIDTAEAVREIQAVDAKLLPSLTGIAAKAEAFAKNIKSATPDPKLDSFIARMQGIDAETKGSGVKTVLDTFEKAASGLKEQQAAALSGINELAATGAITSAEAYDQAQASVAELAPQVEQLAKDALAFAESIRGAKPDPQLDAFIARMRNLAAEAANPRSTRSPANVVGNQQLQEEERKLNEVLSERNQIVQDYQTQVEQGTMSEARAQDLAAAAYAHFGPIVQTQIGSLRDLITLMHDSGTMSDEMFNSWIAKLNIIGTQSQFVSANFKQLRDTITTSFTQGVVTAFDTVTQAIAAAIDGTGSWSDAVKSLWQSALSFAASFLKAIADMIVQMLALKAIQSLPFLNGLTQGILDFSGLAAGATALGTAGGIITAGAAAVSLGAEQLSGAGSIVLTAAAAIAAAAAALAAAAQVQAAASAASSAFALFHSGGKVGQVGGQVRRGVDPRVFLGAPRYHSGGYAGLAPDEHAIIAKKNERILTEEQQRQQARNGASGAAPVLKARIINTIDPADFISAGLDTEKGEQAIMNFIRRRRTAFAAALSRA